MPRPLPAEREAAFRAVARTVQSEPAPPTAGPHDLRYPVGIPDLHQHLDDLIGLARGQCQHRSDKSQAMRDRMCSSCPHQFPGRYCPRRAHGGCSAYRLADQIVSAVQLSIPREQSANEKKNPSCCG